MTDSGDPQLDQIKPARDDYETIDRKSQFIHMLRTRDAENAALKEDKMTMEGPSKPEQLTRDGIRCGTCFFSTGIGDALRCRRNPPLGDNAWPRVDPENWCGEYSRMTKEGGRGMGISYA